MSRLKKLSNDRSKNWGNTLEAMRAKAEQQKNDVKKKQMVCFGYVCYFFSM